MLSGLLTLHQRKSNPKVSFLTPNASHHRYHHYFYHNYHNFFIIFIFYFYRYRYYHNLYIIVIIIIIIVIIIMLVSPRGRIPANTKDRKDIYSLANIHPSPMKHYIKLHAPRFRCMSYQNGGRELSHVSSLFSSLSRVTRFNE